MRISDWSSDVCSSDLLLGSGEGHEALDLEPLLLVGVDILDHPAVALEIAERIAAQLGEIGEAHAVIVHRHIHADRKSVVSGKSVSVRVNPGGSRIIKKKKKK